MLLGRLCSFPSNSISAASLDTRLLRISKFQPRVSLANEKLLNQDSTYFGNQTLSSCTQGNLPPTELRRLKSDLSHLNDNLTTIGTGSALDIDELVAATNGLNEYVTSANMSDFLGLSPTYGNGLSANVVDGPSGDDAANLYGLAEQNIWSFTPYLSQLEGYSPHLGRRTLF